MAEYRLIGKEFVVLIAILMAIGSLVPSPAAYAKAKRGEEPQCQEECLGEHVRKMKELSHGLLTTGHRMEYQDRVEKETSHYSDCLTNCREVLPVK